MTQQVRTTYRNHRRGTWAAAVVLISVLAVAVAPLAGGGNAPKYYSLTADPPTACSGTSPDFTLKLTNESRNNTLGSAEIKPPSYVSLTDANATVSPSGNAMIESGVIKLRGLNLTSKGDIATVKLTNATTSAGSGEYWESVAKQSNDFADSPGSGNLITLIGDKPALTVDACHYYFVPPGPVDTVKNSSQTVRVQLKLDSTNDTVAGAGSISLTSHQGINSDTALAANEFTGLGPTLASNGEWAFSVTGTKAGSNYSLKAPDGTRSSYFTIADCIPGTSGTCTIEPTTTMDGSSGAGANGSGLGSSPIALTFFGANDVSTGLAKCQSGGWNWSPLTFPEQPDGRTTFDGSELSTVTYAKQTGYMKLTMYLRNDLYVQTTASQTNDIQTCVGAKHSNAASNTATFDGDTSGAFAGRDGIFAKWDAGTGLYWGVVARVPNCNKTPDANGDGKLDPVLCAWGTQTINGIDYRSATVLFPYDWDLKGFN